MAVGATGIGDGFPTTSVKEVIPSERVKTESAGETNVVLTVVYRYPSFLSCRSACWRDVQQTQQTRNVVNLRTVGALLIAIGKGVGGYSIHLGRSVLCSPEL